MIPMNRSPFLDVPEDEWLGSNDLAFAIFDRYPVNPGHALVITRRPTPDWWSCTTDEQRAIMTLVGDVKSMLDEQFGPDGYNVGFNAGAVAGQTVPHVHVHVIPRYEGDVADPTGGIRNVIPELGNYLRVSTDEEQ
jgi:diadenosine tetraphosphate (Ap4A) HIT family hydrolase